MCMIFLTLSSYSFQLISVVRGEIMAVTSSSSITTGVIRRFQPIPMRSRNRGTVYYRSVIKRRMAFQNDFCAREDCACFKTRKGFRLSTVSANGSQYMEALSICSSAIPLSSSVMTRVKETWMNFIAFPRLQHGRLELLLTGLRVAVCQEIRTTPKMSTGSVTSSGAPIQWW